MFKWTEIHNLNQRHGPLSCVTPLPTVSCQGYLPIKILHGTSSKLRTLTLRMEIEQSFSEPYLASLAYWSQCNENTFLGLKMAQKRLACFEPDDPNSAVLPEPFCFSPTVRIPCKTKPSFLAGAVLIWLAQTSIQTGNWCAVVNLTVVIVTGS